MLRYLRPLCLAQLAGQDKDQAWHFLAIDDTWQDQYFLADNKVKSPKLGLSLSAIPASDLLPTPNDSGSVRPRPALRAATGGATPAVGPHSAAAHPRKPRAAKHELICVP